jgi:hypothetical protein
LAGSSDTDIKSVVAQGVSWGPIRTGMDWFGRLLSEWRPYSDNNCLFQVFSVRMLPLFGQQLPVSSVYCPNAALIRTPIACFERLLSEWRPYSDTN